ncbi:MAG: hypothetical protein D6732_01535 [Methanobacteriota archaeon]|nr:MAG: hypothetical protein D6732_01535 [Euryarchaeota archaeon]
MPVPSLLILGGLILMLLGLITLKKPLAIEMSSKARIVAFVTGVGLIALGVFFFVEQVRLSQMQETSTKPDTDHPSGLVTGTELPSTETTQPQSTPVKSGTEGSSMVETRTLYQTSETYHLGDESLAGWEKLLGECLTIAFQTELPVDNLVLQFETFGVNEREVVKINGAEVLIVSPMNGLPDDEWSQSRFLPIPTSLLKDGGNRLDICAAPLTMNPSFPGDKDDFQVRNIALVAEYGKCK